MTLDELCEYATTLILEHARDIERLTIFEMAEEHVAGGEITDEDARKIHELIAEATITVEFPEVVAQ